MMTVSRRWLVGVLLWLGSQPLVAQALPDATVADALRSLHARAAVAFAGQVVGLRHSAGVVEIEFRIDQPLKGSLNSTYVLREWSGLWAAGQRRYWLGERAVFFFHASPNGLGSPVDGMEGILPASSATADAPAFDVQRLATRVLRAADAPLPAAGPRMSLTAILDVVSPGEGAKQPSPVHGPDPVQAPSPVIAEEPAPLLPVPPPARNAGSASILRGLPDASR